jgi:branched-chain amino acid transport system ATP-binding protein
MLEVSSLSVNYALHRVLEGVSLGVAPGELVVILGANGAGKTTLLKAVGGLVRAREGSSVTIAGVPITNHPPHRIVEAGIALVPEERGLFGELTVRENLKLGAFARRARETETRNFAMVLGLFPRLAERSRQIVRTLSGGEQQMVAISRALMSAPDFLLLDEPSLGLSPILCTELFKSLRRVTETGVGVLLVEQNAKRSLEIADRGYLLENGHIVGQGAAEALRNDESVKRAYLGYGGAMP